MMKLNELQEELENTEKPVILDFFAKWCGPCRFQKPILHDFVDENNDKIKLIMIDIDEDIEIAQQYGVQSVPTLLLIKNNKVISRRVGVQNKAALFDMISTNS